MAADFGAAIQFEVFMTEANEGPNSEYESGELQKFHKQILDTTLKVMGFIDAGAPNGKQTS